MRYVTIAKLVGCQTLNFVRKDDGGSESDQ